MVQTIGGAVMVRCKILCPTAIGCSA